MLGLLVTASLLLICGLWIDEASSLWENYLCVKRLFERLSHIQPLLTSIFRYCSKIFLWRCCRRLHAVPAPILLVFLSFSLLHPCQPSPWNKADCITVHLSWESHVNLLWDGSRKRSHRITVLHTSATSWYFHRTMYSTGEAMHGRFHGLNHTVSSSRGPSSVLQRKSTVLQHTLGFCILFLPSFLFISWAVTHRRKYSIPGYFTPNPFISTRDLNPKSKQCRLHQS